MTERQFSEMFISEQKCLHNQSFRFSGKMAADRLPGRWMCENLCGYFLCFDPEKYPEGVAYTVTNQGTKAAIVLVQDKH